MKVFLTGGTGFVGSHAARELARRGHEVLALVPPGEDALADARWEGAQVTRIAGDLLCPDTFADALAQAKPDACLHLAWYAVPKDYLSSPVNVELLHASVKLAERLVASGCRRLVGAGTCFEYDTSTGWQQESSPLAPRHVYSVCKRALFELLGLMTTGTATSFAWARLFFLYGPREPKGRLVPAVIDALVEGRKAEVTTGEQIRDFMHVEDAARALVTILESDATGPVNVGSGEPVRVRDVVATIAKVLGGEDQIAWGAVAARPNDPRFVCADVAKLRALGFVPTFDLESGLRDTVTRARRTDVPTKG